MRYQFTQATFVAACISAGISGIAGLAGVPFALLFSGKDWLNSTFMEPAKVGAYTTAVYTAAMGLGAISETIAYVGVDTLGLDSEDSDEEDYTPDTRFKRF